ncbi:peptidase S8/S53 domain-containing protein [Chaetomium sp. MPI-SDFR-AT-0129]|nr:peptidase S8/S53 domain-containing protein [Chaetomium sp. MPI-SDFR-AT-0129]
MDGKEESVRRRMASIASQVLVFASAGNDQWPNLNPIAFPARCPGVFSIHSHDGHGNPSPFTPKPQKDSPNFQVVGHDIQIVGLGGSAPHTVRGTSCSTPIAAGIAAFLLDFSRAYGNEWKCKTAKMGAADRKDYDLAGLKDTLLERCHRLKSESVMSPIMYHCMTDRLRDQHNIVNAEKLFQIADPEWRVLILIEVVKALKKDRDGERL